jgi:hypothetical protein
VLAGIWGINAVVQRPGETLAGVGIVLIGIRFYLYWRWQKVKATPALPSPTRPGAQVASADHTHG